MKTMIFIIFSITANHAAAQFEPGSNSKIPEQVGHDLLLLKQLKNFQQKQGSNFLTVGPGISCDTDTIQNALDAGVDEVRVASNQTYFENIVIDDQSVMLRGGFADCNAANNNNQTTAYTQINGSNTDTVINIMGDSQQHTVVLDNLDIRNGSNLAGGGILVAQNLAGSIFINNSIIQFNQSINAGAGIYLASGSDEINLVINNTEISNNTTTSGTGGGLQCFGNQARISSVGGSKVNLNSAEIGNSTTSGTGGGLYISNGCVISLYSGTQVNNNKAQLIGGGIYIGGSSAFIIGQEICDGSFCIGNNSEPVEIRNNEAGSPLLNNDGGGIYINASQFTAFGGLYVGGNRSRFGAGIYATNNASVNIRKNQQACWDLTRCNFFSDNRTRTVNGTGGAIYNDDSEIKLNHVYFEDNRADTATAIYARGQNSVTTIQNSVFNHNGDDGAGGFNDLYVLRAFAGARIDVSYSTFADNHADTVFGINNSADTLNLSSSIIHDTSSGDVLVNDNANIQVNCVMAHEVSSISGNILSLNNPNFVDRENRDFHLAAASPAIDYCNELGLSPFALVDIDFDERGYDDPTVEDNFTNSFYDIGADEVSDIIFKNGFE